MKKNNEGLAAKFAPRLAIIAQFMADYMECQDRIGRYSIS